MICSLVSRTSLNKNEVALSQSRNDNNLASFHFLGMGRHLGPFPLAVNSSYFALFSLIMFFLMQSVPRDLFLHYDTMQQSWDGYSLLHSEKTSIRGRPSLSLSSLCGAGSGFTNKDKQNAGGGGYSA
jgi:hypothetical protein